MKKTMSLTVLALAVVGLASAQSTTKTTTKAPSTISCAVMSVNKVNIAKATAKHMFADYKGRRYFFCCGGCPAEFKKDPAKFSKSASIPTPKAAATKK
ncbi:MAG: YHS domain-containing protein [Fimbriimonas sp.]|nr:YHS domain-containing protein [Fimbriimonas sp.]